MPSRAYAQKNLPSISAHPAHPAPAPPSTSPLKRCSCPDPNCNAEELASRCQGFLADSHNGAIAVVAQLKEFSHIGEVPGLRAAAGGVLLILETIGAMNDNVEAFNQLASQAVDNYLLLSSCQEVINASYTQAGKAKEQIDKVAQEFYEVMAHIAKTMKALNSRGKIRRFMYAKADKNDLEKHRSAMTHLICKFQTVLSAANLARGVDIKYKELTQEDIHKVAEGYKNLIIQHAEAEYEKQLTEYRNSPQVNLNATANFTAGANSTVTNSGNVVSKVISGQNDYSNHTKTLNITNGDLRMRRTSSSRSRRKERRNRRYSPSDDSEEEDTPRRRQEQRDRRGFEPDGYQY